MRLISIAFALILMTSISNAYQFTLFPMRQGYEGWHIETNITVYNNMSDDVTFKVYATNPVKHTRYNDTGIYDTITNGSDLKEYEDFPHLSWIHLPSTITVEGKNGSNATVKNIPVIVDIPKKYKYSGKHYEALICVEAMTNTTIHVSIASRLLITTPSMPKSNISFIPIWLVISIIIALIIVKRYR